MTTAELAGIICDHLTADVELPLEYFDSGTVIRRVELDVTWMLVTASDGRIYRVTVEEWP